MKIHCPNLTRRMERSIRGRIRTFDLWFRRPMLFQLSYTYIFCDFFNSESKLLLFRSNNRISSVYPNFIVPPATQPRRSIATTTTVHRSSIDRDRTCNGRLSVACFTVKLLCHLTLKKLFDCQRV